MEISVELFMPEMLPMVHEWWASEKFPLLPLEILPKTGIVVLVDDVAACAGWLYKSDSTLGYIEWIVANPLVRREKRDNALNRLISELLYEAKKAKINLLFTSVKHPVLLKRLERMGFIASDSGMTNMVWKGN